MINIYYLFFKLICIVFYSYYYLDISNDDKIIFNVANSISIDLENRYELSFCGIGMSNGSNEKLLNKIELYYESPHSPTKSEARRILLGCYSIVLNMINEIDSMTLFVSPLCMQ